VTGPKTRLSCSAVPAFLGYFGLTLFFFYRRALFFFSDEYAVLASTASSGSLFRYLSSPHNEHFVPLAKLFYLLEVTVFRENYSGYVLTNAFLLALLTTLWVFWLRSLGVNRALAFAVGAVYVTTNAHAENAMWAWQSGVLLFTLFLVLFLSFACRLEAASNKSWLGAIFAAAAGAWSFGTGLALPAAMVVFCLVDAAGADPERRKRVWRQAALAVVLGLFLLAVYGWFARGALGGLKATGSEGLHRIAWLGWYTVSLACFGPVFSVLGAGMPGRAKVIPTLACALLFALAVAFCWRTKYRRPALKLLLLLLGLFAIVAPFRHAPEFAGFANRYFTYGLLPALSIGTLCLSALGARLPGLRKGLALLAIAACAALLMFRHYSTLGKSPVPRFENWGRAARVEYFATKQWLRDRRTAVPNNPFGESLTPWLTIRDIASIIPVLDRSYAAFPLRSFVDVERYESFSANRAKWGPIYSGREALQSIRFGRPAVLTKVELLVARDVKVGGTAFVSVLDSQREVLWMQAIPPDYFPDNTWLALPVPEVALRADSQYFIRLSCDAKRPDQSVTVWTNAAAGAKGDFCFRLAFLSNNSP
jgi:hypothetical protein